MKENEPEDEIKNEKIDFDPTKIDLDSQHLKSIPKNLFQFFLKTISIRNEIDKQNTVKTIKEGIEFYGSNVWILICSIVVASIGLNNDSAAVIIGAMLISPLMGPIRGVGLSIATNDFQTLMKSLINFAIMVGASLLASYLFFLITPLKAETSELLGRTKPNILDVLVAFFGGLAGIIAASTKSKNAALTVVPGVAIATALMPPLCTAGYGLAIGNLSYFLGALYLFLLNSVFIAISTIVLLRVLRFKMVSFVNPKTEFKVKAIITSVALLIIIPSVFIFVDIIKESIFDQNAKAYISKIEDLNSTRNINLSTKYKYEKGNPEISIWVSGEYVEKKEQELWRGLQKDFDLEKVKVIINQNERPAYLDTTALELKMVNKLYENQLDNLNSVGEERDFYRNELVKLKSSELNLFALEKRMKLSFPEMDQFTYAKAFQSNFTGVIDTVYQFNVHWNHDVDSLFKAKAFPKVEETLKLELELATKKLIENVRVVSY